MKLGDRVRLAREHAGLARQEDLVKKIIEIYGEELAPKQQTISRIERNKAVTTEFVVKIAVACNVNPWWLDSELGPMELEKAKSVVVEIPWVDIDNLTSALVLTLEEFKNKQVRILPREAAQTAVQLYNVMKRDGSIDLKRIATVFTTRKKHTKERGHGHERRNQRNLKKDTRQSYRRSKASPKA